MAILKIEQRLVRKVGHQYYPVKPKPRELCNRITIQVPDHLVWERKIQPVIDAYAKEVFREELIGKNLDVIRQEYGLELVPHLLSFEDENISRQEGRPFRWESV
ncbi:hypothetical protein MHB77_32045 [Paenibacillus sp. FSL K6-3166]|uniref:hypothetical protein n=1 Tax=Paenibacillus sp. FSL K6-3166 TaxID=2921492 RepID=UPI0030FCD7E8